MTVASAGPYANHLHLAPDRLPRQHLITQCLKAGCTSKQHRIYLSFGFVVDDILLELNSRDAGRLLRETHSTVRAHVTSTQQIHYKTQRHMYAHSEFELRFHVSVDTKQVILELFFPANRLASTEENKPYTAKVSDEVAHWCNR